MQNSPLQRGCILRYSNWLSCRAPALWLGLAALLAISGGGLRFLKLNVDTDKLFLQQDKNALALREFERKYQIGENVGIYVQLGSERGDLPRLLDRLSLLSRELELLPFVRSVQSLARLWQQSRGEDPTQRLENFRELVSRFGQMDALHSNDWQSMWLLVELYPYEQYRAQYRRAPIAGSGGDLPLLDEQVLAELNEFREQLGRKTAKASPGLQLPGVLERSGLRSRADLQAKLEQPGRLFARLLDQLLSAYHPLLSGDGAGRGELQLIPVGISVNSYYLERELSADLIRVLSIAALICLLCIFLLMQSRLGALGALLCVLSNALLVFGLSGWLGLVPDKTFVMIPVLLGFASSISYCVHLEKSWEKSSKKSGPKNGANSSGPDFPESDFKGPANARRLCRTLCENIRPLSFAALTTVLALLSFIFVPIPMIRTAGLQSALSVSVSYLLSLSLFCSLLPLARQARTLGSAERASRLALNYRPVIFAALGCYRHRRLSLGAGALLLLASLLLLPRLRVDLSTESVLGTRFDYVRRLMQVSRSEIGAGGFYNIDLTFADEPLQAQNLRQVAELEQRLRASDLVKNVTSLTDFLLSVQQIYRGRAEFPADPRQARQALLTWERLFGGQHSQWYSGHSLRILVQLRQASSGENIAHMKQVERLGGEIFGSDEVRVRALGGVFQLAIMNQYITSGLLRSFGLSLLLVALLLFVLLRSWRIGLIALLPNIFPALLCGAAIVLLGRQLEFVSMTVGPMVIGLAVDDTIYFLGHVQGRLRAKNGGRRSAPRSGGPGLSLPGRLGRLGRPGYNGGELDRAVENSLCEIAPALVTTTLILCALFASLLLSQAANIRFMGLYTIIAMLAALFSDLFLTPALLRLMFVGRRAESTG